MSITRETSTDWRRICSRLWHLSQRAYFLKIFKIYDLQNLSINILIQDIALIRATFDTIRVTLKTLLSLIDAIYTNMTKRIYSSI